MRQALSDAARPSRDSVGLTGLTEAVQRYFDLMYDCDIAHFDRVFAATAQLHGYRDGEVVCWPADVYRDILAKRRAPKAAGALRADEILTIDIVSADMAFTKVRLCIHAMVFIDYLTWHKIDGAWLVTSKGFHLEAGT